MFACRMQIKVLHAEHNCATTKLREGKMASQVWCADRLCDWLKKNPNKTPKDGRKSWKKILGLSSSTPRLGQV